MTTDGWMVPRQPETRGTSRPFLCGGGAAWVGDSPRLRVNITVVACVALSPWPQGCGSVYFRVVCVGIALHEGGEEENEQVRVRGARCFGDGRRSGDFGERSPAQRRQKSWTLHHTLQWMSLDLHLGSLENETEGELLLPMPSKSYPLTRNLPRRLDSALLLVLVSFDTFALQSAKAKASRKRRAMAWGERRAGSFCSVSCSFHRSCLRL
ncbi:hypothetical protein B0H13DRAFT_929675 [Mycena leptocephala]|nr:hypothetical protein B0H13DRAFT_929675 [Mycena leptocephala]